MIKHFGYGLVFLCCSTGCGSTPEVERGGTSTSDSLTRTATIGTLSPKLRIGGRGKPTKPRPVDMVARPCRDDLFFVDLALATQTPNGTAVGVAKATEELETEANLPGLPWFCDGACAVSSVTVSVKPVLPERSRDEWRKSGHERFHRIRFHDKSSGDVVSLRPEARCAVVEFMRDRYAGHLGLAPEELFVGRVCDASTMGVAAHATEEMLNWHYDRVGLDGIAPMSESLVDVALLDGGIDTALHSSLGVARAFDFSSDVSGEFHPHGAAMASFIRDLAPSAALFDLRVLDAGGAGTPADVAQAFDFALFELREEGRALIVNMSLGWAPELGDHAQLTGPDCSTYEDPIGEPLRYLMYGSSETSGLSVFSAAGNQPTDVNAGVFPPASNGPVSASCGAGPQTDWFYPARWSSEPSCTATDPSGRTFGAAISGVDDVEDPIATAIPGEEATLVAPGQHVYAQIVGAPAAPEFPSCAAPATNPGFQNPMALTGTSVATAITSGIAARVQSRMREKSLAPLRTDALNRVLYAAGEDLCRVSVLGEPVRRLHAGRLERLLSDEVSCRNALDCVVNLGGAPG
ncbi:MAG: S8/S53 family peptidase, partial [Myxococcota bacterium]